MRTQLTWTSTQTTISSLTEQIKGITNGLAEAKENGQVIDQVRNSASKQRLVDVARGDIYLTKFITVAV